MAWIQAFEWGYFRAFIDFLRWDTWYGKSHKGHSLNGHNSWKLAQIGLKVPPFDSPCPCASDKPIQMPLAICFEILGLMVWFTNNPNSHGGDYYNSKNTPHDKVLEVSWIGFFFLHQREKNRSHPLSQGRKLTILREIFSHFPRQKVSRWFRVCRVFRVYRVFRVFFWPILYLFNIFMMLFID